MANGPMAHCGIAITKLSGTTHNVFGIQVGVGITIAVRVSQKTRQTLYYYRVPEHWRKTEKLAFLSEKCSIKEIEWRELQPDIKTTWITEGMHTEFTRFIPMGTKEMKLVRTLEVSSLFKTYSLGISTNRDSVVYNFDRGMLITKIKQFIEEYNTEVSRWERTGRPKAVDNFVRYDKIKWSLHLKGELKRARYGQFDGSHIRTSMYRPFTKIHLYFDPIFNDARCLQHFFFPSSNSEAENTMIVVSDHGYRSPYSTLVTNLIADLHLLATTDGFQCFPYYTYAEDGSNRRENITDWALAQFQSKYGPEVSKWDIFHYVYAMLHHPQYRERYAENLKRELPRIPLLGKQEDFALCVRVGKQLMELHLNYEQVVEYPLKWIENRDVPVNWRVEKMRLSPAKDSLVVNEWLTLANIPPACYQYRLGNRSALEWVIDQYSVSKDKRSEIVSDPNREDEPEYIVRLVGRVVTVSVETVKLVDELAGAIGQEDWMGEEVITISSTTND